MVGEEIAPDTELRRGRGCDKCHQTGFRARLGVFEVLTIDPAMADIIRANGSKEELLEAAVKSGFATFLRDAGRKVLDGRTTIQEINRAVRAAI